MLAILGVLTLGISYIISKGRPWNLTDSATLADWIWHVPEAVAVVVLLPLLTALAIRQLSILKPAAFSLASRRELWLRFGDWIFLAFALAFWLVDPSLALLILAIVCWCAAQLGVLLWRKSRDTGVPVLQSLDCVALLFFCSGFSAVIYQIVWQRALFAMFGSDVESVTIIVSVFMFGLGVGAIFGNFLLRLRAHLLKLFVGIELLIGLFGFLSLPLARLIQTAMEGGGHWSLIASAYCLFALPTLLMGATLPILVAYLDERYKNIGRSSGFLYAVNTWGSALGAFLVVMVIFAFVGQSVATWLAGTLNIITAIAIYRIAPGLREIPSDSMDSDGAPDRGSLNFTYGLLISFAVGFISLSQELVWYRLLGLTSGSDPRTFGVLLGCILFGIGYGAYRVKRACEGREPLRPLIARALLAGAVVSFATVPAVAFASGYSASRFALLVGFVCTGVAAALVGGVLPALTELCAKADLRQNSTRMGWIYACNIAGATLGPLVTGYMLFDQIRFEVLSSLLSCTLLVIALAISDKPKTTLAHAAIATACFVASFAWLTRGTLERIQHQDPHPEPFSFRIDNRSSVITASNTKGGLLVYGGGVYDGRINTDLIANSNEIDRAYIIPTLHPNIRSMFEIGLSSGAWAAVVAEMEGLQELKSIEINRGYLSLIEQAPVVSQILKHPRIRIEVDDGRRWLRRHPDARFDFILMNTTFHWRSQLTNLLSVEFLSLCKSRLTDGGVLYFNTTGSEDAIFTAAHVFPHVIRYKGFVAASSKPFSMSALDRRKGLMKFESAVDKLALGKKVEFREALDGLSRVEHMDVGEQYRRRTDLSLITDDNMLTEFKR